MHVISECCSTKWYEESVPCCIVRGAARANIGCGTANQDHCLTWPAVEVIFVTRLKVITVRVVVSVTPTVICCRCHRRRRPRRRHHPRSRREGHRSRTHRGCRRRAACHSHRRPNIRRHVCCYRYRGRRGCRYRRHCCRRRRHCR